VPAPLEFWFDFISPYGYLAWQRIHAVAEAHGRELVYRPVLFAGLLNHWGQLGPAEIPPKREFVFRQVSRRAAALGVRLQPPPSHPFNPLLGLRIASLELPTEQRRRLIDTLWRATWGGGPGIHDPAVVASLLGDAGFAADELIAAAQSPAGKQRVLDSGAAGIAAGVFGVPTMIVEGELFWGDDSFAELEQVLRGEDTLDREGLARWAALPASADRRRAGGRVES
jgi:2-hydroxychromene-2-carboxylate isomerase